MEAVCPSEMLESLYNQDRHFRHHESLKSDMKSCNFIDKYFIFILFSVLVATVGIEHMIN
jgi:hypothetical protein